MKPTDFLIDDFTDQRFSAAFRLYFEELGEHVKNWDALFQKMNQDPHGKDYAYLRVSDQGQTIGFIQFTELEVTSWFFRTRIGFIREFWVAKEYRSQKHGRDLLLLAEEAFRRKGLMASILTTDTAEPFYRKYGYVRCDEIIPDNEETVLMKILKDVSSSDTFPKRLDIQPLADTAGGQPSSRHSG